MRARNRERYNVVIATVILLTLNIVLAGLQIIVAVRQLAANR